MMNGVELPRGWGGICAMPDGGFWIDESCGTTPDSVSHSLKNMIELEFHGDLPKFAILGGMSGLGVDSLRWHEIVMSRASLLDGVYLIGNEWDGVVTGQASLMGRWENVDNFLRDFDPVTISGSMTLVKGSVFYGMDKIFSLVPQSREAKICQ
jgi:UDP-N-acetylmuramyl pentapeptide synthase